MNRTLGVLLTALVVLTGCASPQEPLTSDPTTSVTAPPEGAEGTATATPPPTAAPTPTPTTSAQAPSDGAPTTQEEASPSTAASTGTAAPTPTGGAEPEPTAAPAPPAGEDECSDTVLSRELVQADSGVTALECEQGWAYALYAEGEGDNDFIAERSSGAWTYVTALGSATCRDDLLAQGAPESVVSVVLTCAEMEESGGAVGDAGCTVMTDQHGATNAVLDGVNCEDAAVIWASATGGPSYETPVPAADGWSCLVFPDDALDATAVAGSCDAPGYTASFVLYVAG